MLPQFYPDRPRAKPPPPIPFHTDTSSLSLHEPCLGDPYIFTEQPITQSAKQGLRKWPQVWKDTRLTCTTRKWTLHGKKKKTLFLGTVATHLFQKGTILQLALWFIDCPMAAILSLPTYQCSHLCSFRCWERLDHPSHESIPLESKKYTHEISQTCLWEKLNLVRASSLEELGSKPTPTKAHWIKIIYIYTM